MMGTNEIRVAEETVELPKLRIKIRQGSEVIRLIEIDDPRRLLLEFFNRDASDLGLTAEPD